METSDTSDRTLGFTFTETMAGYVSAGTTDFRRAAAAGRHRGERLRFVVTITIDDLDRFVAEPGHQAAISGEVQWSRFLGVHRIERGEFNLFRRGDDGRRRMEYRLWFSNGALPYRLDGYKNVHNDRIIDVWPDTTTLFTTVRELDGRDEPVVATGILRIRPLDLIPQVWSMRGLDATGPLAHATALARFGRFFSGNLLSEYARPPQRPKHQP